MHYPKRLEFSDVVQAVKLRTPVLAACIATNLLHNQLSVWRRDLAPRLSALRQYIDRRTP